MFLLTLTYLKPLAEIDRFLVEHRAWLDTLYAQQEVICSGPQTPRTGGLIFLRVKERQRVEALIQADPFHREGLASYALTEFDPVKYAPEFTVFL